MDQGVRFIVTLNQRPPTLHVEILGWRAKGSPYILVAYNYRRYYPVSRGKGRLTIFHEQDKQRVSAFFQMSAEASVCLFFSIQWTSEESEFDRKAMNISRQPTRKRSKCVLHVELLDVVLHLKGQSVTSAKLFLFFKERHLPFSLQAISRYTDLVVIYRIMHELSHCARYYYIEGLYGDVANYRDVHDVRGNCLTT